MYSRRRPVRNQFHLTKSQKRKLYAYFWLGFLAFLLISSTNFLRRVSMEMAMSDAIDAVTLDINETINVRMNSDNVNYSRFVTLETDKEGEVTAITTDMAEINTLSSDMLSDVVGKGDSRTIELSIPLGNLMGSSLLLGRGPDVPLDIIMLTSSRIEFRNDIQSAGINQTKHRIIFDVIVDIDILIPWDIATTQVVTEVIVAETVIVGTVPNTYVTLE